KLFATDAHRSSRCLVAFPPHEIGNQQNGELRRVDAHATGNESIWTLLKHQSIAIHHYVSRTHLVRYVDEMTWRLNRRALSAEERVNALFGMVEGRLTYNALIGKA